MNLFKNAHLYLLLLVFISSCGNSKILFQENTENWLSSGDATWAFVNGDLVGKAKEATGFVMTKEAFSDFVLELDFKPDNTINSGVFIRCKNNDISATDCHEINIWDLHPNQENRTGAIVTKAPPLVKVETNNHWNTYKIKAEGDRIQIWINNILTADYRDASLRSGYIGLQAAETGEIRFRNVRIKVLGAN